MKMELYRPALELYKQVLKINPKYTKAYFELALCFDKIGRHQEARRYYHKFLEYQPQDENANFVLRRMEKLKKISSSSANLHLV